MILRAIGMTVARSPPPTPPASFSPTLVQICTSSRRPRIAWPTISSALPAP